MLRNEAGKQKESQQLNVAKLKNILASSQANIALSDGWTASGVSGVRPLGHPSESAANRYKSLDGYQRLLLYSTQSKD